ncbi:FAD-binding oxidoreductase [Rhodococcus wratislaviensis]|uniref:Putative oxidoreductase n=1 Tax=Rhodococcus wratislaviensis NBRC 100605 TaxID=1219028 RepID=X0QYG8_RHOWR|nr:FAD-binding oxidoreductase [Rhodococcus wratislaviensis]GAF43660.1 putative oxidoreductase [Rhodococcus wratislaviensis NBRC 100605]
MTTDLDLASQSITAESLPSTLVRNLRGQVLEPGTAEYERVCTLYNGMITKSPGVVIQCLGPADVAEVLRWADDNSVPFAVRAGGHNVAGNALNDGGLVLDVSSMKGAHVDPSGRTIRVQPGVNWGEFDRETQGFGLTTTGGNISSTGVAGLTLGGGIGWLMRKHGLACDSLIGADLITPGGHHVRADQDSNPELLWGLRGGGGNFGVVTAFDFELHEYTTPVTIGVATYPVDALGEVIGHYRQQTREADDDLIIAINLLTIPGQGPSVTLFSAWFGNPEEGAKVINSVVGFGHPTNVTQKQMAYRDFHCMFDKTFASGQRNYWKSGFFNELTEDLIGELAKHFAAVPSQRTVLAVEQMGGAITRIPESSAAFPHRASAFSFLATSMWQDPADDQKNVSWTRDLWSGIERYTTGVYSNFLSAGEAATQVVDSYGASFERLTTLKKQYDPKNLLRYNQNIS